MNFRVRRTPHPVGELGEQRSQLTLRSRHQPFESAHNRIGAVRRAQLQHPLAERWIELEAAELMVLRAAAAYDGGEEAGAYANAAKYCAAEAGFRACETAIMTHGGMGYAREYHVERYFREIQIARIAPVSPQLVLSYIAERVLGLPKSY